MDVLLVELKNGYLQPWLNGKKLEGCREIKKIEKYTDYEKYTLNGNTVIRIRGKFQFENGILSEVKDGD